MTHLTRRQEEIWRKKMVEREKAIIRYYKTVERDLPDKVHEPDGSFCMSAFKDGWYLARRKNS